VDAIDRHVGSEGTDAATVLGPRIAVEDGHAVESQGSGAHVEDPIDRGAVDDCVPCAVADDDNVAPDVEVA
jgi:hypothetical protein